MAHSTRVIEISKLYDKCSTIHKNFTDIEADIETTHVMNVAMKDELDKCIAADNKAAIECQQKDYDENSELLGRHNGDKKSQISAMIKVFNEWEYAQYKP